MKHCQNCEKGFPTQMVIDGKLRNFSHRKYCLECSPFGKHNTTSIKRRVPEGTRTCTKCDKVKYIKEFYSRQSRASVSSWCKNCIGQYTIDAGIQRKKEYVELLGGCCAICGYNKYHGALEFHHLDPQKKDPKFRYLRTWKREEAIEELKKCILVCSNCHREIHAGIIFIR